MNSKESELLYIKSTRKERTLRFAGGIPGIPGNPNYFVLKLQGRNKLCVSLWEFYEFQGVRITLYEIYKEGSNFAFRFRNSRNSMESESLHIKFMRKDQILRFA